MRETRNAERGTRNRPACFSSAFRLPRSALIKHRRLVGGRARRRESEVAVRGCRSDAAARGAGEEALLHQERLLHLLQRPPVPPPRGAPRLPSPRGAPPLPHDRLSDAGGPFVPSPLVPPPPPPPP